MDTESVIPESENENDETPLAKKSISVAPLEQLGSSLVEPGEDLSMSPAPNTNVSNTGTSFYTEDYSNMDELDLPKRKKVNRNNKKYST